MSQDITPAVREELAYLDQLLGPARAYISAHSGDFAGHIPTINLGTSEQIVPPRPEEQPQADRTGNSPSRDDDSQFLSMIGRFITQAVASVQDNPAHGVFLHGPRQVAAHALG